MKPPPWTGRYVLIPFRDLGRDPSTGLDCWGMVQHVTRLERRFELPSFDGCYRSAHAGNEVEQVILENLPRLEQIDFEARREFDLVYFNHKARRWHVGILAGRHFVLHTEEMIGAHVERLTSVAMNARVQGIYRIPVD